MSEIKDECANTPSRNSMILLLVKVGLLMIFLFGVLMRIFIPVENFTHLADVLMSVAVLGRLFMYVRGLTPSLFLPKQNTFAALSLNEKRETVLPIYDQQSLTPLERVISDK